MTATIGDYVLILFCMLCPLIMMMSKMKATSEPASSEVVATPKPAQSTVVPEAGQKLSRSHQAATDLLASGGGSKIDRQYAAWILTQDPSCEMIQYPLRWE